MIQCKHLSTQQLVVRDGAVVVRLLPLVLTFNYTIMFAVLPRVALKPEEWQYVHNMGDTQEWGFRFIDALNALNEINRTVMLWVIRHE